MPVQNQVEVQVQPAPDGTGVTLSISAPDGAMDLQLGLEQAMGVLMDLAKVLGQLGGIDVSQEFAGLEGMSAVRPQQNEAAEMAPPSGPLASLS